MLLYSEPQPSFITLQMRQDILLHIKVELVNPTGSIKYKTARNLLDDAEKQGLIKPGSTIIESSSGNLGIALAALCAQRGFDFICVVDPNISAQSRKTIKAYGGKVHCVTEKDANGGYLGTRINYVKSYIAENPGTFWTNQYGSPSNPGAHYRYTAREIEQNVPDLDLLAIGAGTTGTLIGCCEYFADRIDILAVDSLGSVTFGGRPGPRYVPGLGASETPPIFRPGLVKDHISVPESEAIVMCHWLAATHGYLAGGSTGTVLAGVAHRLPTLKAGSTIVAISPDGGEKYLDTVYNSAWVEKHFGSDLLRRIEHNRRAAVPEIG